MDPEPSGVPGLADDTEWDPADLYRYKTTQREAYDQAARRSSEGNFPGQGTALKCIDDSRLENALPNAQIFDALLHWPSPDNPTSSPAQDLITELTTSNIAIHAPSQTHVAQWVTPRFHPYKAPFLRGVMRTYLTSRGELREEDITVEQFGRMAREGRTVVGMNGLRRVC